jgi:predicted DNA-binding ribbon-helix-helix protein
MSVNELVTLIDQQRNGSLSSAIRVFVLENAHKSYHAVNKVRSKPTYPAS